MISALAVFFLAGVSRADEEIWSLVGNEASLSVTLTAPEGTTDVPSAAQRTITATVQRFTWEVWTSDLGNIETRNHAGGAFSGASVSFSLASGGGSLDNNGGTSAADGTCITTLTMPSSATEVQVVATDVVGTTATAALAFLPPVPDPEIWSYQRSESLFSAGLSVPEGTSDVPHGSDRQVYVHAQYDTWDVWVSNYGNTETRNTSTSPASYAAISWFVSLDGGEFAPLGMSGQVVDSNGDANVTYTMGNAAAILRADLSYAGSYNGAASAAVSFTPPAAVEQWSYDHSEGYISVPMTADGSLEDLPAGTQRLITAEAHYTTWEVWVSDFGNSEIRNQTTSPAIEAALTFVVISGDGGLSTASALTDSSGRAATSFTMGSYDSTVTVCASFAGTSASGQIGFNTLVPETWTFSRTESLLTASLNVANGSSDVPNGSERQVNLHAQYESWEIWESNHGNSDIRNPMSAPANDASITWTVLSGDGTISGSSALQTDANGDASVNFTMGNVESTLTADVGGGAATATATFTPVTTEQWTQDRVESAITVSMSAAGGSASVPAGAQRVLTASVGYSSWEVWASSLGNTEIRNPTSGQAADAVLTFSVESGDGALSTTTATTDTNGLASTTFSMGSEDTLVAVAASFAGTTATGSLGLTAETIVVETWTLSHTEGALSMSLSSSGAYVEYTSWEVWTSNLGNSKVENHATTPAIGASVGFAITSGDATLSPSSASTDGSGSAGTTVTAGVEESTLEASASYGGLTASASVPIGAMEVEVWSLDSEDGILTLSLGSSGASVEYRSWEIWTSNWGGSRIENDTTGPAIGAVVSFSVTEDASVSPPESTTDTGGSASVSVVGGSVEAILTASVSFATKTATASVVISFLDSDGDGHSDAEEIAAGTDPNDAASKPGGEKKIFDHQLSGGCIVSSVKLEQLQIISYDVTYTDEEGTERTGSVGLDLGAGPRAAIAAAFGVTEERIVSVTEKKEWVEVLDTQLPLIGKHAAQFFPMILPGYNFHQWTNQPQDVEVESETNVVSDAGTGTRMTTHWARYEWIAAWQEIEE